MVTATDVKKRFEEVRQKEEQLLFIVGGAGSGKSKILRSLEASEGWRYVEAKELLMDKLFEVAHDARTIEAKESFLQAFHAIAEDVVIIDSVEILFAPIFNLDPMSLFKELSKEHPLIIGWRGSFDGKILSLEHNSKKNYFSYEVEDPTRVVVLD